MAEVGGQFVPIEPVPPGVLYYLLLEDGVGGVVLTVGPRVAARVVVDQVEGAPEAHAAQKRTVPHHSIIN